MKKYLWLFICAVVSIQIVSLAGGSSALAATNLIANPSVESGNTTPDNWMKNNWGQNTAAFTYVKTEGYQSARSVKVQLSNFASGDGKWYFNAVDVQPSADYTFTDWYKANIKSKMVAVSYDAAGTPTYFDVNTNVVASATTWKQASAKIKTLATTKKLSVFHVIEQNGWLQLDNASLTRDEVVPPAPVNFVPNASLETANGTAPAQWLTNSWGMNSPTYEYVNGGRTGGKSVKVTMNNYQSGDAKWFFEPQALERGKDYKFSAWYKTNTTPNVVVRYVKDNGSESYYGLPAPQTDGTSNWQLYSDTFSVPSDAAKVTVFFFLTGNGWVQTDDYSITPYQPTGFTRPLLTLTFDDGFEENVNTVLPRLNAANIKSTQCYATQYVEGVSGQPENVLAFKNSGHEVCSHTVTHPPLTSLTPAQLTYELTHPKQYLESLTGQAVTSFASPFGDYNAAVNTEIKKYYRSHRTTDEGYNSKDNFNAYRVRVQNMQAATTLAELQGWINKAKADKTWLVLVYHRVTPGVPEQFDTKESDFVQHMNVFTASGVTIKTYNAALDEITPQL